MTSPKKLFEYLLAKKIRHESLVHRTIFTGYDLAATLRIPGTQVAKALFLKHEKGAFLAVLSAAHTLDFFKLAKILKVKKIRIPKEREMIDFLAIKKSPLIPFGSRYKLPVVLDKAFLKNKKAVFNAGAFNQSVSMAVKDFIALEKPLIGACSLLKKIVLPKKKINSVKKSAHRKTKK